MRVLNNLPLTTLQAHFNEAVITTRAGFHRDSLFPILEVDLPDITEIETKVTRRISQRLLITNNNDRLYHTERSDSELR
jgi:hypothetical protein